MFDLDRSPETVAVSELARALANDLLAPASDTADRSGLVPPEVLLALVKTGLVAPIDEEFGGDGVPTVAAHLAAFEAFGHGDPGIATASALSGAAALVLGRLGSNALKEEWLRRLIADPRVMALALFEGFGRGPSELEIDFRNDVVCGHKAAVSGAAKATWFLVVGASSLAIVRADDRGVTVKPSKQLGADAAAFCDVTFDKAKSVTTISVDRESLMFACSHVRLLLAAITLGGAQRAIEYAASYANERIAFGKPISTFQGVSFLLAEAALKIGAARAGFIDLASQIDAGDSTALEARTTQAVNYAANVAMVSTRDSIQVLGGHGFIKDHPVERWYRAAATLAAIDHDPLTSSFEPAL